MKSKSLSWYKGKINVIRAQYTKKRDQDWKGYARCISCSVYRPVGELQSGHFYSRIHDFTTALAKCEENLNLQCVPCNYYKRGNPQGYASGLVRKYGVDILGLLEKAKKKDTYWGIKALKALLEEYKEKLSNIS